MGEHPITNAEISDVLERVADVLEAQDANRYRVRAYRAASDPAGIVRASGDFALQHADEICNLAGDVEEREKKENPLKRIMAIREEGRASSSRRRTRALREGLARPSSAPTTANSNTRSARPRTRSS